MLRNCLMCYERPSECAGNMDLDLDGIIRCIKRGDENGVDAQLQQFNKEVTRTRLTRS